MVHKLNVGKEYYAGLGRLICFARLLCYNGHIPSEPGLAVVFIEAKDDGGGGDNSTTEAISRAKLQSNHH